MRYGPCKVVEWREQASCDALTGLRNRTLFCEVARHELAMAARNASPVAVLLIDINDFKQINDAEGHQAGDHVLRDTAKILTHICRREVDLVARWGGDEFVVLLPQTDLPKARELAQRINTAEIMSPKGRRVTLSCGASVKHMKNVSLECLIDEADREMYAQKRPKQKA